MGSIEVRNSLLSKKLKRTETRLLIIDDNQLRYNQVLELFAQQEHQVQAILLDDLKTFEKQLSTFKCNERSFVFSSVAEFLLDYMKEKDFPDLTSFQDFEREIVDKWDDIEGA